MVVCNLKGIVYFGDFHYTSHICEEKHVCFNDGIVTEQKSRYEKPLVEFDGTGLSTCDDRRTSLIVYAQS